MGQALRRALGRGDGKAAAAQPQAKAKLGRVGRSKLVDKERPLVFVTAAKRGRPLIDDLDSLNEVIRRDHARAAAAGIAKPSRKPPWVDRGMTVEEYAEDLRRSRIAGMGLPPQAAGPGDAAATESREWDRTHPNYKFMVEQLAKKIVVRPEFETKPVMDPGPKPQERGTSRRKDVRIPGKLKLEELKEVYQLRYGLLEAAEAKPLDAEAIAKRYQVDAQLLKKVFSYTSLPQPVQQDDDEPRSSNR